MLAVLILLVSTAHLQADGPLRWKFQPGDRVRYEIIQEMKITGAGGLAAEVASQTHQQLDVTWEVTRLTGEGEVAMRLKFDRIRSKMTLPTGGLEFDSDAKGPAVGMAAINAPLYQALVKSPVEFTLTTAGRVTSVKLPEDVQAALKRMPTSAAFGDLAKPETFQALFMPGFPILPSEVSFAAGHQWSVITTAELPGAVTQTIDIQYHYEGVREIDGKSVAIIRPMRTTSFSGSEPAQRKVAQQTTQGEVLFDATAGRVQSSTLKYTATIGVSAGGMPVEQKMEQSIQVKIAAM